MTSIGVIEATIDTSEKVDHELVYRTAKGLHRWEVQHKHRAYGADDVLDVSDMYESQKTTFHAEEEDAQVISSGYRMAISTYTTTNNRRIRTNRSRLSCWKDWRG